MLWRHSFTSWAVNGLRDWWYVSSLGMVTSMYPDSLTSLPTLRVGQSSLCMRMSCVEGLLLNELKSSMKACAGMSEVNSLSK